MSRHTGWADLPHVEGVRHREILAGDVVMHVAEAGDGPPLLLVHGWPQHWWCWRHVIGRLARTHRVLCPDLRGMGWSEPRPTSHASVDMLADLIAVLDAEGLDTVRWVGHDWGGIFGFLAALRHPDRVERLVTVDIGPPWQPAPHLGVLGLPLFLAYQPLFGLPVAGEAAHQWPPAVRAILRAASSRGTFSRAELDVYTERFEDPARARVCSALYRTFMRKDLLRWLTDRRSPERMRVPTLMLMGGRSPLARTWGVGRPSAMVSTATIPGAGHFLPEERPDEVVRRVEAFMSERAGEELNL